MMKNKTLLITANKKSKVARMRKILVKRPSHIEVYGSDAIYKEAQKSFFESQGIEATTFDAVFLQDNQLVSEWSCNGTPFEIQEHVFISALWLTENNFLFCTVENESGEDLQSIYAITINGFEETSIKTDEFNFLNE